MIPLLCGTAGGLLAVAPASSGQTGAEPAGGVPRVDVGHQSVAVARELDAELALPGPHVDVAGGRGGRGPAPTPAGTLVSSLSTAFSDTWQQEPHHGPTVTRVYAGAVNYRDAFGIWQPRV
jgi:hypothetical protein